MIDLETVGTGARCGVIQCAMLQFDVNSGETGEMFNAFVDIDSNRRHGRVFESGTLAWWSESQDLFDRITNASERVEIASLPELIRSWYGEVFPDGAHRVWSNGSDFDLPILKDIFKQFEGDDSSLPWLHRSHRCVRTVKNLDPRSHGYLDDFGYIDGGEKHDARYDVRAQAYQVYRVFKTLKI